MSSGLLGVGGNHADDAHKAQFVQQFLRAEFGERHRDTCEIVIIEGNHRDYRDPNYFASTLITILP